MSWSKRKSGLYNTSQGTVTANGSSAVVVNPPAAINANSQILLTLKTVGGTPAGAPYLSAITVGAPGTCTFSVKSAVGDTSIYNYSIQG